MNTAIAIPIQPINYNVVNEYFYNKINKINKTNQCNKVRYTKNGEADKRHCNRVAGISSEVYAFRTDEEIERMLNVFNARIDNATTTIKKRAAERDKLLFIIGINIGIRASDLRMLKWNFFFNEKVNGEREFKDHYTFQPKKQRSSHKFVTIKFNSAVKTVVENFINKYPVDDLDSYIFLGQQGDEPIQEKVLWKIIKNTAKEAGITQNVGSHSLRKTFGYRIWNTSEDKDKALVMLQLMFSHSDTRTTMKYIGILQDDLDNMYDSICLGVE